MSIDSSKMTEFLDLDLDNSINMLVTDHEITVFNCLVNDYVKVVNSLNVSRNSSEVCHKIFSDYIGHQFNYNIV